MSGMPVYLIDASIYIFQAHFSPHTQIWSTRSEDRSAFAGFSRFLLRFLQQTSAERIAVAFDESLFSGFRHRLYPDYKSNRVLPDDNLARQLNACARLCEVLGVKAYASQEYEADDIIGTLSQRVNLTREQALGDDPAAKVVIVSRDKDLAQLLYSDDDYLWDFHGGVRRHRKDIFEHYGIWPEQFPCYLGLTGDSIDCIPGVPGVGPVAARELLRHFDNLDTVIARCQDIAALKFRGAARCARLLEEHAELAILSRELARIVNCPVETECFAVACIDQLARQAIDSQGFNTLLAEMALMDGEKQRLGTMLHALLAREAA